MNVGRDFDKVKIVMTEGGGECGIYIGDNGVSEVD